MRLDIQPVDATTTRLVLDGRMDAPGCDRIETAFTAAASASGGHVLVDLTAVSYIGSLGIRLLISCARVVHRRGRRIVLFGAQEQPRDVFETVAIADLIPVVTTEAEAVGLATAA
ncbi:MAG: STAS domain-containing protein [Acetobacteraceae bacterium]|nr:STAS domain-containing protein [Acetobacteraceae bacterium]